jgi:hypothetical protein
LVNTNCRQHRNVYLSVCEIFTLEPILGEADYGNRRASGVCETLAIICYALQKQFRVELVMTRGVRKRQVLPSGRVSGPRAFYFGGTGQT